MTKIEYEERYRRRFAEYQTKLDFVLKNWDALVAAGANPDFCDPLSFATLDIDRPARETVMNILKAFPGKWDKEQTQGVEQPSINYQREVAPGIVLRLWASPPPPTCKLVEEEVVIPAQPERIEKRMKLVCKEESAL